MFSGQICQQKSRKKDRPAVPDVWIIHDYPKIEEKYTNHLLSGMIFQVSKFRSIYLSLYIYIYTQRIRPKRIDE